MTGLPAHDPERRWPVALTLLVVLAINDALPQHLKLLPDVLHYGMAAVAIGALAMVEFRPASRVWLRLEDAVVTLGSLALVGSCFASLAVLIGSIVGGTSPIGGFALLTSSVSVWANNMLGFSLLYWVTDRGGPKGRLAGARVPPDWMFPQMVEERLAPPGWEPRFVDYLSLAFWTATAFSPTDTAPLTAKAKLMMMAQASISLATLALVASRAINVLGA